MSKQTINYKEKGYLARKKINDNFTDVYNAISNIADASPNLDYATLSDLNTAFPSGATGVYVIPDDGHWYYWNGSAWTDGGVYQSTSDHADVVTLKDAVLRDSTNLLDESNIEADVSPVTWGTPDYTETYAAVGTYTSPVIEVVVGETYAVLDATGFTTDQWGIAQYSADTLWVSSTNTSTSGLYTVPAGIKYIRVTKDKLMAQVKLYDANFSEGYETYGEKSNVPTDSELEATNDRVLAIENDYSTNDDLLNQIDKTDLVSSVGEVIFDFGVPDSIENATVTYSTSIVKRTSQSVKSVSLASNNNRLDYTGLSIDVLEDDVLSFFLYADEEDIATTATIYLSINDVVVATVSSYTNVHGWNCFKWVVSADTTITSVKLLMQGASSTVYLDSIVKNYKLKPCVLLNFDSMYTNLTDIVYPLLKSYNYPATFAFQNGHVFTDGNAITKASFLDMLDDGWDYSMYGAGGTRPASITDISLYDDWVDYLQEYLDDLAVVGVFNPSAYFAPNNAGSDMLVAVTKELGFKSYRMSNSKIPITHWDEETFEMPTGFISDSNLSTVQGHIDDAIEQGNCVSIFTHSIYASNPDPALYTSTSVYTSLLNYIKTYVDNGQLEVITYRDFYSRMTKEYKKVSVHDLDTLVKRINYLETSL